MLNVTVEDLNDSVVLHCSGGIVRGEETALLCIASQHHGQIVVLDFGGVDRIDAAGIGLLVSLQAAGIYLRIMNPNENVREILKVTHLDSIFDIYETASTLPLPEESPVEDELESQQSELRLTA